MYVWIVWSEEGPVAVFSSEQRALAYIVRHGADDEWSCSGVCVNLGDGLHALMPMTSPEHGAVLS